MIHGRGNRRQHRRYPLRLRVELPDGAGVTRNVSEGGVLFETTIPIKPGQEITFSLVFGEVEPEYAYRVRCRGEVVRVEPAGEAINVAVKLHAYGL
jgi:hypothetical protein